MIQKSSIVLFMAVAAGLTASAGAEILLHYGLDETTGIVATDSTGGHDGAVVGGSWAAPGAQTQTNPGHLVLEGTASHIEITSLPASVGDFTFMTWVKKTLMNRFPWLIGTADGSGANGLQIAIEEEYVEGLVSMGCKGWAPTVANSSFRSNRWEHLAFVRDGTSGEVQLYVNGVLEHTFECGPGGVNFNPFWIGNWPTSSERPLNGGYDDFALWDEKLQAGAADGSEPGTINYYRLNGVLLREQIQFDRDATGAMEGVSPAAIGVSLHNGRAGVTYTVNYSVSGGTATSGTDYQLTPGTLTFNPGETSKTVSIGIVNDGVSEADETIILTLSAPSGGAVQLGSKSQHIYTIYNDRPPAMFASELTLGSETVSSGQVAVNLSYPADSAIEVGYSAVGGSATAGADYELAAGTLTFAAGETSRSFSVQIIDDWVNEATEKIIIGLSSSDTSIGTPGQHAYSIADDEDGIPWDGLVWYHSEWPDLLDVTDADELQWAPRKYHQVTVRLPEKPLAAVGDVVEFTYMWKSDGLHGDCSCDHTGDGCDCFDADITCLAGTSGDFHLGLFDSNDQGYIDGEYQGNSADIFNGYLGYDFRIYPHIDPGIGRVVDCRGEVHKPGSIEKRTAPYSGEGLLKTLGHYTPLGDGEMGGFGLEPDVFSPLTLRLERTAPSTVEISITLNGITRTRVDSDATYQPQKIDVFAMYFHHSSRKYSYATLDVPQSTYSNRPSPFDGSVNIPSETILSWNGGTSAESFDVYFGTDEAGVGAATRSSRWFKGNQTSESYDPRPLSMNTTYYWRIDDVTTGGTVKGAVWSFTTADCDLMETFEYGDPNDFAAAWQGAGGATGWISLSTAPKHGGQKSMELQYFNFAQSYSAAVYDLGQTHDFTQGHGHLGIYLLGQASNPAERLYAIIEDNTGATAEIEYSGSGGVTSTQWFGWGIDLRQISGVDLTQVSRIHIGLGDPDGLPSSTSGKIWVDDIGLCRGRCQPGGGPSQDLDGDCLVNFLDHAVKAQGWTGDLLQYKALAEQWLDEILVWP